MIGDKTIAEEPVYGTPWVEIPDLKGQEVPHYLQTLLQWANSVGLAGQRMRKLNFDDGKLQIIVYPPDTI